MVLGLPLKEEKGREGSTSGQRGKEGLEMQSQYRPQPASQIALRPGWSFRVAPSLALPASANKNTGWPVKFEF